MPMLTALNVNAHGFTRERLCDNQQQPEMKLVVIIYIVFLFVSIEDLFMELLIVALIGLFVGNNVPLTKLHQECLSGDQAACDTDKKINPYVAK